MQVAFALDALSSNDGQTSDLTWISSFVLGTCPGCTLPLLQRLKQTYPKQPELWVNVTQAVVQLQTQGYAVVMWAAAYLNSTASARYYEVEMRTTLFKQMLTAEPVGLLCVVTDDEQATITTTFSTTCLPSASASLSVFPSGGSVSAAVSIMISWVVLLLYF
eukprot:RCo053041